MAMTLLLNVMFWSLKGMIVSVMIKWIRKDMVVVKDVFSRGIS